ncbi:MAG: hypothetical protein ABGZ24_10920 [Fuerstiella sp.]
MLHSFPSHQAVFSRLHFIPATQTATLVVVERFLLKTVWLMQNHLFDLQPGQSVLLGDYKVTLLEIEDEAAVLEIEGPDGEVQIEPISCTTAETEEELAVLA